MTMASALSRLLLTTVLLAGCGTSDVEHAPTPSTTRPAVPGVERPVPTLAPSTIPDAEPTPPPDDDAGAAPVDTPAEGVVGLTRREVDTALANLPDLERHLADAETDPGRGRRLLRVVAVPRGSLLERLGLRPDDVVARVNRRWVLQGRPNPLWDALRGRRPVTVVVLRDGEPHTYQYVVD